MKIAFLHTSAAHIATFDSLLAETDVEVTHRVEEAWLQAAINDGLSNELSGKVEAALKRLSMQADGVICTCSTLGSVAMDMNEPNIIRIDAPMMAEAARHDRVLLVMCLESTVGPSSVLLESAYDRAGRKANYRTLLCSDAWPDFEAGRLSEFGEAIAGAVLSELARGAETDCIVLAQASMRAARTHLSQLDMPVLSSPELAVAYALRYFSDRSANSNRASVASTKV